MNRPISIVLATATFAWVVWAGGWTVLLDLTFGRGRGPIPVPSTVVSPSGGETRVAVER